MNKDKLILRTRFIERASHWVMVLCFLAVALSGLSWFFPSLNGLNAVFGTPQLARILHPFFGVVVFLLLAFLFVRFVKYNLPEREDLAAGEIVEFALTDYKCKEIVAIADVPKEKSDFMALVEEHGDSLENIIFG